MDLSVYSHPRKFQSPYRKTIEYVGGAAVLWVLLTGPFYFWKKGAMIEALAVGAASLPFWAVDSAGYLLDSISGLIWLGAVLFAPLLLVMSYGRRGWVDVTDGPPTCDVDAIENLGAWPRDPRSARQVDDDPRL